MSDPSPANSVPPSPLTGTTPEFVLWSLGASCSLRDDPSGQQPEWVERQLRALRACGTALVEGREFQGYCLEPSAGDPATVSRDPLGFSLAEVLAAYGDAEWLDDICGGCVARVAGGEPAIVPRGARPSAAGRAGSSASSDAPMVARWAGCFGWIEWSSAGESWHDQVSAAMDRRGVRSQIARHFLATLHPWYGLFAHSPLTDPQRDLLVELVAELQGGEPPVAMILSDFAAALRVSAERGVALSVAFGPVGELTSAYWTVLPHCPRCKAPRLMESRRCGECGQPGAPTAARRRFARGPRPYGSLLRMMNRTRLDELLTGYWRQRPTVQ